jgi:hypothetical protein
MRDAEKIFQTIKWKKDKQQYDKWIQVPFDAQDVINHARTSPSTYKDFLKSNVGRLLIAEVIKKLNQSEHMAV